MTAMKRNLLLFLTLCLLFSVRPSTVRAEDAGDRPRKALLIGNDIYENPKVPNLSGAVNDTEKMELMLLEQKRNYDIVKLHNAKKDQMIRTIRTTFAGAHENDLNFVFYAGHGAYDPEKKSSFLVGTDDERIYADELEMIFRDLPGTFLLVFDACNSGGLIDDKAWEVPLGKVGGIWSPVGEEFPLQEGLEEEPFVEEEPSEELFGEGLVEPFSYQERGFYGSKYYVIAAAHKLEASLEKMHHNWGWGGFFTRAYVRANGYRGVFLADKDQDNRVTYDELVPYVKAAVRTSTVTHYPKFSDLEVGASKLTADPKGPIRHNVPIGKVWEVRFNGDVDAASARQKIQITDWKGATVSMGIAPSHNRSILRLRPENLYQPISYYKLTIQQGLASPDGQRTLKKDVVMHFFTDEDRREEEALKLVKEGKLEGYPKKTVGEAFGTKYFKSPTFTYKYNSTTKEDLVIFTGQGIRNGKPETLKAVFTVDLQEKSFVLSFIGIGDKPLSQEEKKGLLDTLFN